jgi:O-antigen/teichoic acid export membrane protein
VTELQSSTTPPGDPEAEMVGITSASPELATVARGGVLNLAGSAVSAVGAFALVVVVSRRLGPAAAGAFLEAVAVFQMVTVAGQLGADTGLARFVPRALAFGQVDALRRWSRLAILPVAGIGVVTGAAFFLAADALASLVADGPHADDFATSVRVFAPAMAVTAVYGVLQAGSRGFGTMLPSVLVERVARPIAQPVAVLAVLALGLGPLALAAAWAVPYVVAAAAMAAWYAVLVRRSERLAGTGSRNGSTTGSPGRGAGIGVTGDQVSGRAFWGFAAPRALAGVFQVAVVRLDILLVGALASPLAAGVYSAASRWLIVGLFVALAVNHAVQPQISAALARRDLPRAQFVFQSATAWAVCIVWPIHIISAAFGPVLMQVFGPGYEDGATVLVILAGAGLFASVCGPVDMVLLMGGASRWNLLNAAVAVATNVVGNILLVPRFGVTGAAIAWAASIVLSNALPLVQVHRKLGMHPFGSGTRHVALLATVAVGIPALLVRLVAGATIPAMIATLVLTAPLYGALIWRRRSLLHPEALRAGLRPRAGGTPSAAAVPS